MSSRYASASEAMLSHRYGYNAGPIGSWDLLGDRVADEMFGSLPTQGTGTMELWPVLAPNVDEGTVQLVPLLPEPQLSGAAEDGVHAGFADFMKTFGRRP